VPAAGVITPHRREKQAMHKKMKLRLQTQLESGAQPENFIEAKQIRARRESHKPVLCGISLRPLRFKIFQK
jgi:hypothetical protein